MSELPLTPEQEAEAQALFARLKSAFEQEAWQMARFLASKEDRQLLGGRSLRSGSACIGWGRRWWRACCESEKKRLPRGEPWLSALSSDGPLCRRPGQRAGKVAGAGAV